MKTKFLTIVATVILAVVTSSNTFAADNNTRAEQATVLTNISRINKIEVYGNVELFVSDGTADQVKVYNRYYAESALVQSQNGVLRISSYKPEKLVVWVTAADLSAIAAYDNAAIKSFGSLAKIDFDVVLHNNATADLNLQSYKASVTVRDDAKVTLSGNVNDYSVTYNKQQNVMSDNFVAVSEMKTEMPVRKVKGELAGL